MAIIEESSDPEGYAHLFADAPRLKEERDARGWLELDPELRYGPERRV